MLSDQIMNWSPFTLLAKRIATLVFVTNRINKISASAAFLQLHINAQFQSMIQLFSNPLFFQKAPKELTMLACNLKGYLESTLDLEHLGITLSSSPPKPFWGNKSKLSIQKVAPPKQMVVNVEAGLKFIPFKFGTFLGLVSNVARLGTLLRIAMWTRVPGLKRRVLFDRAIWSTNIRGLCGRVAKYCM